MIAAPDGSFYSAEYNGNAMDGTSLQLSKINSAGEVIWTEHYDDESKFMCSATSIRLTDEGNVVMGSCSVPMILVPRTEFRLVVTDSMGTSLVDETYSQGIFDNYCYSAIPLGEEGYALFGHTTYPYGSDGLQRNIYFVRTDTSGVVLSTQEIGDASHEEICYSAIPSQSGGYLIGGGRFPLGGGVMSQDFLLIQTSIEDATPSEIVVSPDELDFGTVWVHDTLTLPVEITLTGETPVEIEGIQFDFPSGFEIDIETPYLIQPEETLEINITFQPNQSGDWTSSVIIVSNAVNNSITIDLIAEAIVNDVSDRNGVSLPEIFEVSEAYPNPFNPSVSVQVTMPDAAGLKMQIFDVLGREVFSNDLGITGAGYHTLNWNAEKFSAGIYFLMIDSGINHSVKKVMLVK